MKATFLEQLSASVLLLTAFFAVGVYSVAFADSAAPEVPVDSITLKLDQVLARALQANRHLQGNALLVQGAQYSLESAHAVFDWKVQPVANLGLSKSEQTTERATGIAGEISKVHSSGIKVSFSPSVAYVNESGTSSGVGASLSIPLLRGFGRDYTLDAIHAADFSLQTSSRNVYLSEVDTVLEAVTLVYEIIRQQELVKLYDFQEKRLRGHVATAQIKESTGIGTPTDTYRALIQLKDIQDQLTVAQEKYQGVVDRLKLVLALPMESDLHVLAPVHYTTTRIEFKKAVDIALKNRIEIEQTDADLFEAKRKSRVAEQRLLPDLNFVATYRKNSFLQGLASSEMYYGDYWSVGLTSSTDFARSEEKAAFQQSLLEVRRVKLQKQSRRDIILAEVKEQLTALGKEEERIALQKEQIVQARGKMRLAEIKFSHGMGDNFDLIESETQLQRAKVNFLSEKIAYIVSQYRLRAALGTLINR